MAVKNLFASLDRQIKVVSRVDEAVAEDLTQEEYAAYLKDLDETKLRRKEGCEEPFTYFHLKPPAKLEDALRAKDKVASLGMAAGSGSAQLFTVMKEIVAPALVDITFEGQSLFEKNPKGTGPSERVLLGLLNAGVLADLFSALQVQTSAGLATKDTEQTKKN